MPDASVMRSHSGCTPASHVIASTPVALLQCCAPLLRRRDVEFERNAVDDDTIEVCGGFDRDIPLPGIVQDLRDGPLERAAMAAAPAGADLERVARCKLRDQHLGVR